MYRPPIEEVIREALGEKMTVHTARITTSRILASLERAGYRIVVGDIADAEFDALLSACVKRNDIIAEMKTARP